MNTTMIDMIPLKLSELTTGKVYRSVINDEAILITDIDKPGTNFFGNETRWEATGLRCNPITGDYEEIKLLDNLVYDVETQHDHIWETDFTGKAADEIMVKYGHEASY